MDSRLKVKSDLYVFGGYVLIALALLVNPLTIGLYQNWGYLPQVPSHHLHANDIRYLLPALIDVLFIVNGVLIVFSPRRLRYYLNDSFGFNLFMFVVLLGILFSTNVIYPGKWNALRLLLLLTLMFFLTNALYQAVVKKRDGTEIHPFYRNIAVSVYGICLVLLVLEGIFMFHTSTHRFNGTLGSRAWFLKNWELNSEGYRDEAYDSTSLQTKRKVLVIGDSFVAGHGIKDPKKRFSDLLASKLPPNIYRVFNLGVGGSDTRDENKRLREFPFRPDLLVMSWYPNDIELDGELGGLILQHARSYHDIWGPIRYFARRSFLWNYLYWRFPHADELSDYFGYIKQCFAYIKVRAMHFQQIDRLVAYGDSLHIPMAAVVFPFLENAEGSAFATDVIEQRFRQRGVPVISVRSMIKDLPAADFIVNQNDPHPNEKLHAMVADSLHALLQARGAITDQPLEVAPPAAPKPQADTVKADTAPKKPAKPKPSKPSSGSSKPGGTKPKSSSKPSSGKPSGSKPAADKNPGDKSGTNDAAGTKPPGDKSPDAQSSDPGATANDGTTPKPKPKSGTPKKPKPGTKPGTTPGGEPKPAAPKPSDPKPATDGGRP